MGDAIRPTNLTGAYELHAGDIRKLPEFRKGWFYVQDLSSQICALALGAASGETVLDLCAAPGGKTCTIAEYMQGTGQILAFELQPKRVPLITKAAERLHLSNVSWKRSTNEAVETRVGSHGLPHASWFRLQLLR